MCGLLLTQISVTMRYLLFAIMVLRIFTCHAGDLHYEISPVISGTGTSYLQVRLSFEGNADGSTELALPNSFGPAKGLFACIRNLRCASRACTLLINRDKHLALLKYPANTPVEITYEVVQDEAGAEVTKETAFRPLLRPDFFHVMGCVLFVTPVLSDGSCNVTVEWRNLPSNWLVHSSFGSKERAVHFSFAKSRMIESVFWAGEFRILKTMVKSRPVYLAIRGNDWPFTDEEVLNILQKTVATQRKFWQDWDIPYYTVTLMPMANRPVMAGGQVLPTEYLGTGLRNSFAAFITPSASMDMNRFQHLFNHEMMHNWIGNRIRSGGGPNDMHFSWFSEGFTEYFALKNMLEGGFITLEQYIETINADYLEHLYSSPIGELPNEEIAADFFKDPEKAEIPYKRGFVFAFFLDNAIKSKSGGKQGLHDFMIDLLDYYSLRRRDLLSGFEFFEETLSEYLMQDAGTLIDTYIRDGKRIPPPTFVLPGYLHMETDLAGIPRIRLNKYSEGWNEGIRR